MAQSGEEFARDVQRVAAARSKSRSLKPLRELVPYLRPYRARIAAAFIALLCSAAVSLLVPQALRIMIDRGFHQMVVARIGIYFLPLVVAAALWGLFTAVRFYYVTWLGERVVADIRKAVFDNVLALTPAFFEVTRTGEVLSRLTADTTLVQTVVGSSVSLALRNMVTVTGALILMFVTSLKLALLVLGAVVLIMLPMLLFGRWVRKLSRQSQDSIAETSARGTEILNAVSTVQAFTQEAFERREFGATVERAFAYAKSRTVARAILTAVAFFTIFASLATGAMVGLQDIGAGRMTPGLLVQFIFYGGLMAGGVGALSETWGDLQ